LGREASRRGIAWRQLDLDFAFHSAAMGPIREALIADLADIASKVPAGDLVSTVTGRHVTSDALDAMHWWRNIRDPVRFAAAVAKLIADGYRLFVEIGPNPVLLSYLREALHAAEPVGRVIVTLDRQDSANDPFPAMAARLHVAGYDIAGSDWFDGPNDPRGLPLYPWQRERFWFDRTVEAVEQANPIFDHPLLGFCQSGAPKSWLNHLDTTLFPFLADHRVDGIPVLPAAAIIDMALAAARTCSPDAPSLELRDIELLRPMALDGETLREVRSTLLPNGDWQMVSRKRLADEAMTVHATARVAAATPGQLLPPIGEAEEKRVVAGANLYRRASRVGLDYGESFRTVREIVLTSGDQASVTLGFPTPIASDFLIAPTLLDGAFQGLLALLCDGEDIEGGFLPRRFGRVRAVAPFGRAPHRAALYLTHRGQRSATADIALYDAAGEVVAELVDCGFVRVEFNRSAAACYWRTALVPSPLAAFPPPTIFDRLPELLPRLAARQTSDPTRERDQALLFEALIAATAREAKSAGATSLSEPLHGLLARFGGDELPASGELWRLMLADYPEMVAELALVAMLRDGQTLDSVSPSVAALRQTSPPARAGRAVIAAALDEIAAAWPRDRPLRVRELSATSLWDRLNRSGASVIRVGDGEPCDLAFCVEAGAFDLVRQRAVLAPGGALVAVMPQPNPLWALIVDRIPDWRAELASAGFVDIGAVSVALGPWPCEVVWARVPAATEEEMPHASLLLDLIVDGVDGDFAGPLEAAGHRVATDDTRDAVLLAVAGGGDPLERTAHILPLLARIAASAAERQLPLWLVTHGAQQPGGDSGEIGAALWGFGRVLRNETPGLMLRSVDLPPHMGWVDGARYLARELAAPSNETEIVWTRHGRHVLRLRRGLPPSWAGPGDAVVAASERPGRLDDLVWAPAPTRLPRPGEIEIEVRAAGVNFRDVMAATGALPEEALFDGFAGAALGLECAGVVRALGPGVEGIAVGDRVAGFATAALASRVVTRADAVIAIPPDISFAAAATLPVAFVTARYSLLTLARLKPGESVLIHAASGGVGLAAIQTAKARGATVIATAGSAAKRAFLRLVGADHVCDSRELGFVAAVREVTGGAGVDVVLNSLHGEAMEASLELLKPFGRFVELGKRDFYENRRLQTRPLRRNLSYFAVDVDQLSVRRPELGQSLLDEMASAHAAGEIRPLAHRCFAFAEIAEAFRLMQAAQHIGKLVLVPDDNAGVAVSRRPGVVLRRDGSYVVTGGLDGFGFAMARWLAERGAGHLALIGRRGRDTPGVAERCAELEALGAAVSLHAADVSDSAALGAALDVIRDQGMPIRGVIHAAVAIVDGMAAALSFTDVAAALQAKLGGALSLDRLTRDDPLDLFWLFSSATTLIGAPGQGAYVAANSALEAVARRRHAEGKPVLAIAWGPIADTGILAVRPIEREGLARRVGGRAMIAARALSALPAMVASGLPIITFADLGWDETHPTLPILATPIFDDIRATAADAAGDEALIERLSGLGEAERRDLIAAIVGEEAARVLRLPGDGIDLDRPLAELGLDSLMALELRLAIETRLRLDLPAMSLADGASVAALASRLSGLLARPSLAEPINNLVARHEGPLDPFALDGIDPAVAT